MEFHSFAVKYLYEWKLTHLPPIRYGIAPHHWNYPTQTTSSKGFFCKASIRNAYYFHKIWTLPAQWIKCSNGDMIIIASCRMAIFVKMIKTIGRWKLEGIGDDDEEKDYPPMMIEVLLAQTAHKRSSLWWSVVATEHYDHHNYIAHIWNKKGQYFDPPKMIFSHWFSIIRP